MYGTLIIVGLGPGNPGMLPFEVWNHLNSGYRVVLRTAVHPTVKWLEQQGIAFLTMDHHYNKGKTFEEVYNSIAQEVIALTREGTVIYAVPGHPMVAEETVLLLLKMASEVGINTRVVPAMSFLDAISAAINFDPSKGLFIADALHMDINVINPRIPVIVTQVYNRITAGETKLELMEVYPDEHPITVIRGAGIPGEERVERIPLYELDRISWIDHLTSLFIEPLAKEQVTSCNGKCSYPLDPLVEVMATLRSDNGCPWDREQTHHTLKQYMIEETYEVIDAIDEGQMYKICEELGDLLLQIVFHAQIASENQEFNINDVIDSITEKMIRRHPHVFGAVNINNSSEVLINWDKIKAQENGEKQEDKSYLAGIPRGLPALLRAEKVQSKAARVGFDWPSYEGALEKVNEELNEVLLAIKGQNIDALTEEVGDLLFAVVNLSRLLGIEAEGALTVTTAKFIDRFKYIEKQAKSLSRELSDLTLEQMDLWWEEAKKVKI